MSNVSIFNGGQLPAHLQNSELDEVTKKLLGRSGGGLRISIKGGVWRMLNNGEEIQRNEDRALNVVIVNAAQENSRTFYGSTFTEGENKPPTCWSTNGIRPEAEVATKMSATCATCQMNVAGSGSNGSRACKYSRNLALTLENDPSGNVFKISLPATSIFGKIENGVMPLDAYVKLMSSHRVSVTSVVTEMKFDTTSATPKIGFKFARFLTEEECGIAKMKGQTPEALEATRTTVFATDNAGSVSAVQPVQSVQPVQTAAAPAGPSKNKAELMAQMEALKAQLGATETEDTQPVVMAPKTAAGTPPADAASLLQGWEEGHK